MLVSCAGTLTGWYPHSLALRSLLSPSDFLLLHFAELLLLQKHKIWFFAAWWGWNALTQTISGCSLGATVPK